MVKSSASVASIFALHWEEYCQQKTVSAHQQNVIRHLINCRTAVMGGHLYRCDLCENQVPLYNSCRDRHCPTCQCMAKDQWFQARQAELLPVSYFHAVFTLPHDLNDLVMCNQERMLKLLFTAVNTTLQSFAADPRWRLEGKLGFIAILHTWSQTLNAHYHLHCIIPGGVWRESEKRWVHSRKTFLFRVSSLAEAFKNIYLEKLEICRHNDELVYRGAVSNLKDQQDWDAYRQKLNAQSWIVYCKPPVTTPEAVLDYLGRYTHRVAISNERIITHDHNQVAFTWRDRQNGSVIKTMSLSPETFIRRFLLHILPLGFVKIRFFGWLAHNCKQNYLEEIRLSLEIDPPPKPQKETFEQRMLRLTGKDITRCPFCKKGTLIYCGIIPKSRSP